MVLCNSLILASASPRRQALLKLLRMPFDVIVPQTTEWEDPHIDPKLLVQHNAALKAQAVARLHPSRFVLGADTTVCIDGMVLNKPIDLEQANQMLRLLSGRKHFVYTAIHLCCLQAGLCDEWTDSATVYFKKLDQPTIDAYFSRVNPFDKAGGYGIQAEAACIIDRFEGLRSTIMGLPIEKLMLRPMVKTMLLST